MNAVELLITVLFSVGVVVVEAAPSSRINRCAQLEPYSWRLVKVFVQFLYSMRWIRL